MSTRNPRLNVVLEAPLYKAVKCLAKQESVSLSLKARDLIRQALGYYEDLYWVKAADQRDNTMLKKKALTHKQAWR